MNIPIFITCLRFILAPFFCVLVYREQYAVAFLVLCVSGVSDFIDGYLARKMGRMTELGAMLDPVADKVLMFLAFVTLSVKGYIPLWMAGLVIGRDVSIVIGILVLRARRIAIHYKPLILSKWTTFFQILLLIETFSLMYVDERAASLFPKTLITLNSIHTLFLGVTAILTVLSGIHYSLMGYRYFKQDATSRGRL